MIEEIPLRITTIDSSINTLKSFKAPTVSISHPVHFILLIYHPMGKLFTTTILPAVKFFYTYTEFPKRPRVPSRPMTEALEDSQVRWPQEEREEGYVPGSKKKSRRYRRDETKKGLEPGRP